jgi:hypothetical protein
VVKKSKALHASDKFCQEIDILSQYEPALGSLFAKKKGDGDLPSPFPLAHTLPQVLAEN